MPLLRAGERRSSEVLTVVAARMIAPPAIARPLGTSPMHQEGPERVEEGLEKQQKRSLESGTAATARVTSQ